MTSGLDGTVSTHFDAPPRQVLPAYGLFKDGPPGGGIGSDADNEWEPWLPKPLVFLLR